MTKLNVYQKGVFCGILEKYEGIYTFTYDYDYFLNSDLPPVSLTIPKTTMIHRSEILFPFFFGLLTEGNLKTMQCKVLKIDENDHFSRLKNIATYDTVGSVRVELFEE